MNGLGITSWTLDFHAGIPVYRQIIHRIRAAISVGAMKPGDQLPTIRELHQQLGVNPNTVARAYRELALMGDIDAEQGSGCFVSEQGGQPKLSAAKRRAIVEELCTRITAEAQGRGIGIDEIVARLSQQRQS